MRLLHEQSVEKMTNGLLVFLGVIAIAAFAVAGFAIHFQYKVLTDAPCSEFRNYSAGSLPARCLKEFGITHIPQ